jgi:hypothetical protein
MGGHAASFGNGRIEQVCAYGHVVGKAKQD